MNLSKSKWEGQKNLVLVSIGIVTVRVLAGLISAIVADSFVKKGPSFPSAAVSWVAFFNRWDARRYIAIAKHGYTGLESHAFYPGYPLLIRLVSRIFGYQVSALVLTWIAAVFAIWGVIDVARRFASQQSAFMAGTLLAWNPVSIFFMVGYPEALLVATMIWSLRFCLEKQWWQAALLAAIASCTLPQGTMSAVVLLLAVVLDDRRWWGLLRGVAFGAIGELGFLGFATYCWATTGNPLTFQRAEALGWQNHLTYPFHVVLRQVAIILGGHQSAQFQSVYILDACAGVLGGVAATAGIYLCWRDRSLILPSVLLALGVLSSVITIDKGAESTARFIFFLAPLYVIMAVCADKLPRVARIPVTVNLVLISSVLAVLFGAMFNLGWWMT